MFITKQMNKLRSIFCRAKTWILFVVISLQLMVVPIGQAQAQVFSELALTNSMVYLTPPYIPVILKGIKIYPEEPFKFDFIIDKGDSAVQGDELEAEVSKLVKYFLASLTIPDDDLWVNLSPYEKDRIIPKIFGETEMGRDLLAQDYILKQLTSSLLYPEDEIGSKFWERVYSEAQEKFGTTDIPVETFNKIWIIPERAVIYEYGEVAYVTNSRLKVMLEEDYLAMSHQKGIGEPNENEQGEERQENKDEKVKLSTQILREVVIPAIEEEVNEGKNFAALRQIYNSLILATWFKRNLKESMFGRIYLDQNKIEGVDVDDKEVKEKIYQEYLKAFKDGVYDYIKEEYDYTTQQIIPRKYFSGGTVLTKVGNIVEENGRPENINARSPLIAQINVVPEVDQNSSNRTKDTSMLNAEQANSLGSSLWEMRHYLFHEVNNFAQAIAGFRQIIYQDNKGLIDGNEDFKRAFDFMLSINPNLQGIFKPKDGIHDNIQMYRAFEQFRNRINEEKQGLEAVLKSLSTVFEGKDKGNIYQKYISTMLTSYEHFVEYLNRVLDNKLNKRKVDVEFIFAHSINSVPASASGIQRMVERIARGEIVINKDFVNLEADGLSLEVDDLRMTEVFINILKNANETMKDGGRIELGSRLSQNKDMVELFIKDTGGGIKLEDPNSIFEDFVSTKGEFGTGVGLAISKRIIENHGGKISAENWSQAKENGEIEAGAIFRITLPVIQNEAGLRPDRSMLSEVKVADLDGGAKIYSTLLDDDFQKILTTRSFYEVRDENGVITIHDTGRSWAKTDTSFATLNGRYGIMSKLYELGASTDVDAEPIVVVDWGAGDAVGVIGLARELEAKGIRNVKIIAFANQIPESWHNAPKSVTFILDTPKNFKAIYEKLMNDAGINKKIGLIYSNLGLSHYFRDGPRAEVTQHLEDLFSILSADGEIRTTIISGFGPVTIDSSQFRTQRVVEENYSSPEAWYAGRLFYYRVSRDGYADTSVLGDENDKMDSDSIKSFSAKDAILSGVRGSVNNRYSIKGDIYVNPITGSFSKDVAGRIKYLFAEIANELIDNAVEAQKEGDIIVRFEPTDDQGVRFKVANLGGINWNKLISKAKAAARNNTLFSNKEDGKLYFGDFYGLMEGFEPVSENDVDAIVQLQAGLLKLITTGGLTEEKGAGVQGGSGYGLQLVQGRVDQLGGVLGLDSQPDSTTFTVTLPKISRVNYAEGSSVDVEFTVVENKDSAILGGEFAALAASVGIDEESGLKIIRAAKSLVMQVHDKLEGLDIVLISGYSSMLSKTMFELTWDNLFPTEKRPRVVALSGEVNKTLYKDQVSYDMVVPAWKKDEVLRIALDEEGLDYDDIRYNQRVLFLDEYVGSGQKYKMMRNALVDQLSFKDINFGFFFSQGSKNVEGEYILIGMTDASMSLELATVAVELADRTEFQRREWGDSRDKLKARKDFINTISLFMQQGLKEVLVQGNVTDVVEEKRVGGIDLDTRNLEIETRGDGFGFEFSFDMNGYENMTILGFSPMIIQIVPISNAAMLLAH